MIINITPYAECTNGIAKWRYTHGFLMGMTSLCYLCYPDGTFGTWRGVQLSRGEENQFLFDFLINSNMVWIKTTKLCSIMLMKVFIISIVLLQPRVWSLLVGGHLRPLSYTAKTSVNKRATLIKHVNNMSKVKGHRLVKVLWHDCGKWCGKTGPTHKPGCSILFLENELKFHNCMLLFKINEAWWSIKGIHSFGNVLGTYHCWLFVKTVWSDKRWNCTGKQKITIIIKIC